MHDLRDDRVDTDVGSQQVFRGGEGPALVYLHSATGETPAFAPFHGRLAARCEVVAPMLPGFGDSEGLTSVDDVEDVAFHVLDLLDRLDLHRPVLVGTSLGGWIAAEVAVRWPERLSRLVLVNPLGLHVAGAPVREIFGRDPGELAGELFADPDHPLAVAARQLSGARDARQAIPFEVVRPLLQHLAATARIGWNPYLHDPKLPRRLHRARLPVLVVRGCEDRLVPPAHARRYADLLPDARLLEIPGAGHLLPLERPAELADAVLGFVGA